MLQAQQVRVDPRDNVWIVDQLSTQVIKFDSNGRVQMVLSRKPEVMRVPTNPLTPAPAGMPVIPGRRHRRRGGAPAGRGGEPGRGGPPAGAPGGGVGGRGGGLPGAGVDGESFQRPTDVAWDSAGNIYVADGYGNARVAKYEPSGTLHQVVGLSRHRRTASSTSCTASPSMRRATCTWATRATSECRCSMPTARTSGDCRRRHSHGALHHARSSSGPLCRAHRRPGWDGRRRDL